MLANNATFSFNTTQTIFEKYGYLQQIYYHIESNNK